MSQVCKAGTVLITGANRGIGMEFVKQLAKIDSWITIIACCRNPSSAKELQSLANENKKIIVKQLDVTNEQHIDRMAKELVSDLPQGLNLLINNAAISSGIQKSNNNSEIPPSIACETSATFLDTFKVNVVGPFLLSKNLMPLLIKGAKQQNSYSLIFNVSSVLGSIQENTSGGHYSYRISKAALNMLSKSMSIDLTTQHVMCVSCHPGWVLTEMGGPNALIDSTTSIAAMLDRIMHLTPSDNGSYIRFDGAPILY